MEDPRFSHPTCPDKRPHPGWQKPQRYWPLPGPFEDLAKNFEQFYPSDKSNIYKDHLQEGKVQPVMSPNQDPSARHDLYRKKLKSSYDYDRRKGNWSRKTLFTWGGPIASQAHDTETGMTYDPRDKNPWHINRYYSCGQLDFRDDWLVRRPDLLVAENWKPITEEETRAVKERAEILGRNRRYFWKLKYHPKFDGHFNEKVSDAQFAKWNRIHSQFWYIFNVRKDRLDVYKAAFLIYVAPLAIAMYYDKHYYLNGDHKFGRHLEPVVNKYGSHVMEYKYGEGSAGPKSLWTRETYDKSWVGWFMAMFANSTSDDWSPVMHDQYRRTVAYGKGQGQLEEWPKMPDDWEKKQHHYWNTKEMRARGSGFRQDSDFWKKYEEAKLD